MRPKALVAFDLDGTLLDAEGRWHPEATKAIAALKDAGYALAVNTGRLGAGFALEAARRIAPTGLHAYSDGGMIADASGLPKRLMPFSEVETRRVYEVLREFKPPADILTASRVRLHLPGAPPPHLEEHIAKTGTPSFAAPPEAVLRHPPLTVWLAGVPEATWTAMRSLLGDLMETEVHGPHEGRLFVGLRPRGRHKGTGLIELARAMDVPLERTVMVGDGKNDVPALSTAGLGLAMGNGVEEAKRAADLVVSPLSEGGLMEAVEHIRTRFG